MILKVVEPKELRSRIRQINVDKCQDELCQELRREGRHADELIILPNDEIIVVEEAEQPNARDGRQILETFRKLIKIKKRVIAVVVVAKKRFDKRDKGIITQALRSECLKHDVQAYLLSQGRIFRISDITFKAVN